MGDRSPGRSAVRKLDQPPGNWIKCPEPGLGFLLRQGYGGRDAGKGNRLETGPDYAGSYAGQANRLETGLTLLNLDSTSSFAKATADRVLDGTPGRQTSGKLD